jgi:hypothetical protein
MIGPFSAIEHLSFLQHLIKNKITSKKNIILKIVLNLNFFTLYAAGIQLIFYLVIYNINS